MDQGKDLNKSNHRNKEKRFESIRDRGRSMRNSSEKNKNEIHETDDDCKQSKSEKASVKSQATQDSSALVNPKIDTKKKTTATNGEKITPSIKEDNNAEVPGKIIEEVGQNRTSKRVKRPKLFEDEREGFSSSLTRKISTPASSKSSGSREDSSRLTRSKVDFSPGAKLEARDYTERWYPAKVVEVDWEDEEVLVHFEKWSHRFDEWISMDSPRLRPPAQSSGSSKNKATSFREGDKVMAFWLDRQKYPAQVMKVLSNDNYEIMFYDGYSKTISGKKMMKATDQEIEKARKNMPKPSKQDGGYPAPSSSIFTDTDIGTKEDRRRRKRKLNVAGLFSKNFRQSTSKKEAEDMKKAMDESLKMKDDSSFISESKGDSQNDEESPEEGRLVYDSEDEVEADTSSSRPSESIDERSSPPRGKGMRTKFKAMSKEIKDSAEDSKKRKVDTVNDSSTDFLRLRFKSRKATPTPKKRVESPPVKETEKKTPPQEIHSSSRKPVKEPVHVPDKRLPVGWKKYAIRRKIGASAGKWDIYMESPEGRKIRTPHALRAFFAKKGMSSVDLNQFDFAPSKAVFPRDGGRPALALSPEEVRSIEEENVATTSQKPSVPGPPVRLSSGGPKVLLPKVPPGSQQPKRLKTLMPRVKSTESLGEPPLDQIPDGSAESAEALWKETNCKMDSTYICPKEGCSKHFRKENLLQMHIKHYHPEFCKLVGSAPNVADLASARMDGGESVFDIRPARARPLPVEQGVRGRGRGGRWSGSIKRASRTSESYSPILPEQKSVVESPPVAETDGKWEVHSSPPTIKTLLPVKSSESTEDLKTQSIELDPMTENGVQLVQEVVSDTPMVSVPLPRRKIMGVGRRKRRLTFLPTHMAKRRKFAMKASLAQAERTKSPENKGRMLGSDSLSSQKLLHPSKRQASNVGDGKVPVIQLQKLKVTTDSRGRVILSQPQRKSPQGFRQKGDRSQPKEVEKEGGEKRTVSGLAVSSSGVGNRRRRKRKSELLSREEIVNCVCGSPEEDGLMMQCELCLCWQHGHCNNIEREIEVPEKYVCYICLNPLRERKSMKYFHDQDWLKKGVLPSLSFCDKEEEGRANQRFKVLKKSHELAGSLLQLKTVVHSLRVKVNMIGNTDHPKLYLWSKSWEANPANEPQDACVDMIKEENSQLDPPPCSTKGTSQYGDITKTEANLPELTMEPGIVEERDKDTSLIEPDGSAIEAELYPKEEVEEHPTTLEENDAMNGKEDDGENELQLDNSATLTASSEEFKVEPKDSFPDTDVNICEEATKLDSDVLQAHGIGDDDCPPVLELPLSQSEIQQLASTVEDKLRDSEVRAPQPEAPIDPMECQLTLLDHIESMQQEVDSRLTLIEAQVAALEAEDDDIASDEPPEFYPRTKQTIQMIMRDLNTARRIAAFCGKT